MTGNVIKRLLSSGNFLALAGNAALSFFNLVTFLIMVRVLSKELFGQWILFMTFSAMTDMLKFGLTGSATIRLISTSDADEHGKISGTAYHIGVLSTLIISVVLVFFYFVFRIYFPDSHYIIIFLFYPVYSIVNLPYQQAGMILQGEMNFRRLMVLKIISGFLIMSFILIYMLFFDPDIQGLISALILSSLVLNIFIVIRGWDHLRDIRHSAREVRKQIMAFGKYSTASYIGSNLLRSSDTIILSLIPAFGINAIAIYSIPLKFIEFVEMPLRSFTTAAFPKLSKVLGESKMKFGNMLNDYTVFSTVLFLPVILILILFPEFFLRIAGGEAYSDSLSLQKSILYIICLYILILPLDRYSGLAFFALDKPEINFFKISIMLISNIVLDLIALLVFDSLMLVAVATVLFTIIGIIAGWFILHKQYGIGLSFRFNTAIFRR